MAAMETSTSVSETNRRVLTLASTAVNHLELTASAHRSYCALLTAARSDKRRSDQKVQILENLQLLETNFSSFLPKDLGIFDFRKSSWLIPRLKMVRFANIVHSSCQFLCHWVCSL